MSSNTDEMHTKTSVPQVGMTYQRRSYYLILCSNRGLGMLCDVLYQSLQFRDFRMAANVSVEQLKYCTALAIYARSAQLAVELGYIRGDIPELSQLLKAVKGLQLPSILARYIECLGKVKLAAGPWIAPWFSSRDEMQNRNLHQIDLDDLLVAAQRPVPENYWSIDRNWISEWNQATTRPSRLGMSFRTIAWSEFSGTVEMIVTPVVSRDVGQDWYRPTAPQSITDVEAQLGACYFWRSFADLRHWPEQTSLICTRLTYGTEVFPSEHWSDCVVRAFVSAPPRN